MSLHILRAGLFRDGPKGAAADVKMSGGLLSANR